MKQAEEFQSFSNACERMIFSIMKNRRLTEKEALIVEHYCKEILAKVAPFLPNRPPQTPT
jgi:hypothetical protein